MSEVLRMATTGGPSLLAGAVAFAAALRFIKWAAPFVTSRLDKRADRLDAAEADVNQRFNQRLKHVELELDRYRRATMKLVTALAKANPTNPVLSEVAQILSEAIPIETPDHELDELLARASAAVDQSRGGKS